MVKSVDTADLKSAALGRTGSSPVPGTTRQRACVCPSPEVHVIVLNLSCDDEHLFEGWFASSAAYDEQRDRGLVSCPVCGSTTISRRPSAPYVNTGASAPVPERKSSLPAGAEAAPAAAVAPDADVVAAAMAMLRRLGRESEDVGDRFADEARRIHHGDSEARNIRGRATRDDVSELMDEGIAVLPLPADEDLH